ncbi:hypothetical protein KDW69_18525 [Burkholderia ambifaria]|uniref:hypothetical protein n=1 Tax=Burkholderia ambifaria TaxID=152480 RepID=UPI001B9F4CAC|nr:hypothetical protein [Burkholderia ambifaria]MBR8333646.1 hypothetical protein [Burkholderia ambifaria]
MSEPRNPSVFKVLDSFSNSLQFICSDKYLAGVTRMETMAAGSRTGRAKTTRIVRPIQIKPRFIE